MHHIIAEYFLFHIVYVTQLFLLGHTTHFVKVRCDTFRETTCGILSVTHPYEIVVYSVFAHISTCIQSVDQLFHTLMVLWDNEYFLTFNLLCPFTSIKSVDGPLR